MRSACTCCWTEPGSRPFPPGSGPLNCPGWPPAAPVRQARRRCPPGMGIPEMKLDVVDAAELAELLQFLSQWLARDPARLGDSLAQFVSHPAYGLAQLRGDLQRFVFLPG